MKLLMFDFDGVIVDTFFMQMRLFNSFQKDPLDEKTFRDLYRGNFYDAVPSGPDEKIREPNPFFLAYAKELEHVPTIEGMEKDLKKLREAGYRMIIISSTFDQAIKDFLVRTSLDTFFEKIYGVNMHKKKTVKIRKALQDLETQPQDALFITDTLGDIREAAQEHVRSIAVTWGYHPVETLKEGNPIAIVNTPEELREKIEELA